MSSSSRSSAHRSGHRTRTALATAFALLLLAASAACGDDDSTSTGADGSQELTEVTLAFPFLGPGDVPFYLADAQGYFADHGLDVNFTTVQGGNGLAAAVGGSVQFVYTTALRPIAAIEEGQRFYAFMGVNLGFTEDVIMSTDTYEESGLTDDSTVEEKVAALAGRPLGVISAGGENAAVFRYLFDLAGLDQSDLDLQVMGDPQATLAALQNGAIDATNLGSPYPATAVQDGYADYVLRLPQGDVAEMQDIPTSVIAVTDSYYNDHRDEVESFLAAYQEAVDEMYEDPTAAAELVYEQYFSDQPKDPFMSSFDDLITYELLAQDPALTDAQIDAIGDFAAVGSETPRPDDWRDVFTAP